MRASQQLLWSRSGVMGKAKAAKAKAKAEKKHDDGVETRALQRLTKDERMTKQIKDMAKAQQDAITSFCAACNANDAPGVELVLQNNPSLATETWPGDMVGAREPSTPVPPCLTTPCVHSRRCATRSFVAASKASSYCSRRARRRPTRTYSSRSDRRTSRRRSCAPR